jgi:hypothetical protein
MERPADPDDLRFRLDWPADGDDSAALDDDELADFSFDWEQRGETGGAPAEPDTDEFTFAAEPAVVEPDHPDLDVAVEPLDLPPRTAEVATPLPPRDALADDALSVEADAEVGVVDDDAEPIYFDPPDPVDVVRNALDDNNDALRVLSEAMYELASNVRMLVDEVERLSNRDPVAIASSAGDVTATAMLTLTTELGSALEKLSDDITTTRTDMQSAMDDVVAAAAASSGGKAGVARLSVELERVQSELQALKRRLPVRAKELDAQEIAEHVAELVLDALSKGVLVREPVLEDGEEDELYEEYEEEEVAPPPRRAARPVKAQRPVKAVERPVKAARPVKKAATRRSRPLRPE